MSRQKALCILASFVLCCSSSLRAHYVMGPVEVNRILKSLQKSRQVLDGQPSQEEREEAVFNIAFEAYTLMKLINTEIEAHGLQQQGLINLAMERCQGMGAEIRHSEKKSLYLYDFEEFEEYLRIAPQGKYVAQARFALIEQSFYQHVGGEKDPESLLGQLEQKKEFLEEYPDFSRRAELEMLLTLDYYELYFVYQARNDVRKTKEYEELVLGQCRHIMEAFPGTEAANFALNLLMGFGPD